MIADRIAWFAMVAGVGICVLALGIGWLQRAVPTSRPALPAQHQGATADWSPKGHVAQADTDAATLAKLADAQRRELADAQAVLQPHIDAMNAGLAKAFRAFDVAMVAPMRLAGLWHAAAQSECIKCSAAHDETFGHLGDDHQHTGLRAFRIDTPTGELPIVLPSTVEV